jgi:general secretion pathway protein D
MNYDLPEATPRISPRVCLLAALTLAPASVFAAEAAKGKSAGPQPGTPASVVEAAQKEIERRQLQVKHVQTDLGAARQAMKLRDFERALASYTQALDALPEAQNTSTLKAEAVAGFRDASIELAKVRIQEGRYPIAEKLLNELLAKEPTCQAALRIKSQLSIPGYYNKTITPLFRADIEMVKQYLLDGEGFYETGRYEMALKRADQVLAKDPTNIAARKLQEKTNLAMSQYGHEAYNEARARALAKVDRSWASPVRRFAAVSSSAPIAKTPESSESEKVRKKLNDIVIPEIAFADTPIKKVAESLSVLSQENDKSTDLKKGVVILVDLSDAPSASKSGSPSINDLSAPSADGGYPINLPKLVSYKLIDVLNAITSTNNLKIAVQGTFVKIVSATAQTERIETRQWNVPPSLFAGPPKVNAEVSSVGLGGALGKGSGSSPTPSTSRARIDPVEFLKSQGVTFDIKNSTATYNLKQQLLTVWNTQDMLDKVETVVGNANEGAAAQVEISAKFVEFTQQNLKELSFDWLLGQSNVPGSSRIFSGGGNRGGVTDANAVPYPFTIPGNSGLPNAGQPVGVNPITSGNRSGGRAIGANAIDALLAGATGSATSGPAAFALAGVFTDPQFQLVIHALDQAKAVDLLSSPSITTRNEAEATIELTREFRYPTEFSPPQVPQTAGGGGGAAGGAGGGAGGGGNSQSIPVTPTTPTAFDMRGVGVKMAVTPTIQGDGYTIDLNLKPEVTEFEGFVNYGSPINSVTMSGTQAGNLGPITITPVKVPITDNVINQPIFSVRKISTVVSILDGETIALGGLIREDVQKVEDKVPVLGDIPLVGRMFRSKVDQHIKKNLTIFVSVKLIDAAGQPVNAKDTVEESAPSTPVPSLTEPSSLPLLGGGR